MNVPTKYPKEIFFLEEQIAGIDKAIVENKRFNSEQVLRKRQVEFQNIIDILNEIY